MSSRWPEDDPAWRRGEALRRTRVRARLAIALFGVAIGMRLFDLGAWLLTWVGDGRDHVVRAILSYPHDALDEVLPFRAWSWFALVAFLVWLYRAVANVPRQLRPSRPLPFSPGMAVVYFFIPLGNLFLPYKALSALRDASDPGEVPFTPEVRDNPGAGYREPARQVVAAKPSSLPAAWIATWCAAWGLTWIGQRSIDASSRWILLTIIGSIVADALSIHVIRSIGRLQTERVRRLDALQRAGIDWQPAPPVDDQAAAGIAS